MKNNIQNTSEKVIHTFIENPNRTQEFNNQLVATLHLAKSTAEKQIHPDLFEALPWPLTLNDYIKYLTEYSHWIPQESKSKAWNNEETDEHQEVLDRLNHFYWLIQQKGESEKKTILENFPWFNLWMVDYAISWGSFLNTTDSFQEKIAESFMKYSPSYRVEDSMINGQPNNPSGWLTFNQFFARELNPGLRPISSPSYNSVVTCPADCTYRAQYAIAGDSSIPEVKLKLTHKFANIAKLLDGSEYKHAFKNGTFVHYFLGTHSYHRFHTPVAGTVKECYPILGLVGLDVIIKGKRLDAPDNAATGYQFTQARGVLIIDTKNSPYGNIGLVAILPVGMCQVSSVNMIATVGSELLKGDEFGYFLFGGSDIIVLFQEGTNPQIDTSDNYRHYGTTMAKCSTLAIAEKAPIE